MKLSGHDLWTKLIYNITIANFSPLYVKTLFLIACQSKYKMKHINETLQAHLLIISPFFCSQKQHILPFFWGGGSLWKSCWREQRKSGNFIFYVRLQPPGPHNNAPFFFFCCCYLFITSWVRNKLVLFVCFTYRLKTVHVRVYEQKKANDIWKKKKKHYQ